MNRLTNTVSFLIWNIVLPLAVLSGSVATFLWLGTVEPPARPEINDTYAAQLQRLPAAEVMTVRSMSEIDNQLDIAVDGEVVPYREVQIATEVAGRVVYKAPDCEAGSFIREGQLLFRIDPTDYKWEISRLEQQKKSEYESLREIDQEITNAEKLLEIAKQDELLREREIKRLETLPEGFASETELDQAKKGRFQSLNARIGYQNQLALLTKRRLRQETTEQLVETRLEMARINLDRTEIKAPISGVVYSEQAELNSFVQRGTVIITMEDTSKSEVIANLRMDELFWVLDQAQDARPYVQDAQSYRLPRTEATVEYRVNGRDTVYRWRGWLERYDGIGINANSRMVPVAIMVPSPDRESHTQDDFGSRMQGPKALVRGMFVKVILHTRPRTPLTLVPNLAIQPGNRVWKFTPDVGVLGGETASTVEGDRTSAEFDSGGWQAGRLTVLENINPISSIELASADGSGATQQFWVCESTTGSLEAGDQVIVSPLGDVAGDGSDFVRVSAIQNSGAASAMALTTDTKPGSTIK